MSRILFESNERSKADRRWYQALPRRSPLRFVQVSCGKVHNAVLSSEGEVFAWKNVFESVSPAASPLLTSMSTLNNTYGIKKIYAKVVKSLRKKKVVNISVSLGQSAAITDDGDVYHWGSSDVPSKTLSSWRIGRLKRARKVVMSSDNLTMVIVGSIVPDLPLPAYYDDWEEAISPWVRQPSLVKAKADIFYYPSIIFVIISLSLNHLTASALPTSNTKLYSPRWNYVS
jgi:hypothetical protein